MALTSWGRCVVWCGGRGREASEKKLQEEVQAVQFNPQR
jgi:hypothetical protein